MGIYTFKQVPALEVDKLITFIDEHWKRNHALVNSRELLKFQHFDSHIDKYNFIVAENSETKEYDAIIGFIPVAQYDKSLIKEGNYWGAIWKYREDIQNHEINNAAFYIWKQLFKLPYFQSYAAIGISEIAKHIYITSRMTLGCLSQYYILNDRITEYKIAGNVSIETTRTKEKKGVNEYSAKWINIEDVPCDVLPTYKPQKSLVYFIQRYEKHPIYKYKFIGVYKGDCFIAVLACRVIEVNGAKCIRVVDVLGMLEGNIYHSIIKILYTEEAEYLDLMNYGIDENVFLQMGFNKLDIDGTLIIPYYFEPFEQRNVKIEIAWKADFNNYVAFKADSDQDRPSIL